MRIRRSISILASIGVAATFLITTATQTQAVELWMETDNVLSPEACNNSDTSGFKFHIYYNSGLNGSYRNIGYDVTNFDVQRVFESADQPLKFCILGVSSPWPGSGQHIKNNAASGWNSHYTYSAHVYYNSGFKGVQDIIGPYQAIDRFVNVYNENASFQWTS